MDGRTDERTDTEELNSTQTHRQNLERWVDEILPVEKDNAFET